MKQAETRFKEWMLEELRKDRESWWVKTQQVSVRGTPDLLGCVSGRFVALELKDARSSHVDALQSWNVAKIQAAGGFARVVSREDAREVLQEIERWRLK